MLPEGFTPPAELIDNVVVTTAITRTDLSGDVRVSNAGVELINRTRPR